MPEPFDPPEWETRTFYYAISAVQHDGRIYYCTKDHFSGHFNTDHRVLDRWRELDPELIAGIEPEDLGS